MQAEIGHKSNKICSSCDGLGYAHRQVFGKDGGFDLQKEKDCLLCKGSGIIFR